MTTTYATQEPAANCFREYPVPGQELRVAAESRSPRVVVQRTVGSLAVHLLAAAADRQQPTTLGLRGELDLVTAPVLLKVLLPILEKGTGPLVIDLSELSFMDSTGVHILVDAHRRLEPQDRRLTISVCEHGPVHRLIALVGLLDAVTVPSQSSARALEEADLAGPTTALAMARGYEPARPAPSLPRVVAP